MCLSSTSGTNTPAVGAFTPLPPVPVPNTSTATSTAAAKIAQRYFLVLLRDLDLRCAT